MKILCEDPVTDTGNSFGSFTAAVVFYKPDWLGEERQSIGGMPPICPNFHSGEHVAVNNKGYGCHLPNYDQSIVLLLNKH